MRKTQRTRIQSGWRVRELESRGASEASDLPWLPARVPGHVHLDLMQAGVLGDPFYRLQERSAAWVDETDWVYETTFHVPAPVPHSTYLLFHGLDTVAEVTLNGELLGTADNMFIPHEFDVAGRLLTGDGESGNNTLRVVFRSALQAGRDRRQEWSDGGNDTLAPHWNSWGPRSFVRKAQYMYGWDWGPELVSCGIWQPVELVQVPVARLLDWKYDFEQTGEHEGVVRLQVFVERASGAREISLMLTAALHPPGGGADHERVVSSVRAAVPEDAGRTRVTLSLAVDHPQIWWPNGHTGPDGAGTDSPAGPFRPFLYGLDLALHSGEEVDRKRAAIGLRTVELVQEPDADGAGQSFKFRVNGTDMFAKGANWIPADSFPSRLSWTDDPEYGARLSRLLEDAADAGFNMLRVWGGGLYESEDFYDLCDGLGILVWQDFPYGCAYYPDTGRYAEAARAEAMVAVRRLRSHTSLALWCGNNENHQMHHDGWTGRDNKPPRFLGEKLYHEILPAVVEAEDPGRQYWPSSPFGGENPNSTDFGDSHDWNVWHGVGDWTNYTSDNSRFVSEFGFASSCGLATWNACLAPTDRWPHSPAVKWHDKTRKGYDTYLGFIALHFPPPGTLEDLVYYSQLNQAEAMKCALEHWRRLKGRCWGLLIWQINDCWPVQSWSLIDSLGEAKASYHSVRRAYEPVLLSLVRAGERIEIHLTNDLAVPVDGQLRLSLRDASGQSLDEYQIGVTAPPNAVAVVSSWSPDTAGLEREVYLDAVFEPGAAVRYPGSRRTLHQSLNPIRNLAFLAEPKDLAFPRPSIAFTVTDLDEQRLEVVLQTDRIAPYVWLRLRNDVTARWSDNFFHLRPGSAHSVVFEKTDTIRTPAALRGALLLRSL